METLPDTDDPHIKAAASNILHNILPYLKSPGHQRFVKDVIEDELFRYEAETVRDPLGISALCTVAVLGLVAGFFTGSL